MTHASSPQPGAQPPSIISRSGPDTATTRWWISGDRNEQQAFYSPETA